MDEVEEDVSARVLLRNVLQTESARSPVTTSVSHNRVVSSVRKSSRARNTPRIESPQVTLRHKLKQKLHESATQSPLPPSKRPRSQSRTVKTPAVASSSLYDEDITTRGLLRGIIQTEAETSLLLSGQPVVPETLQQAVETSLHSNRQSEGPSELELPDLVTEPLTNVIRGMSRRRPPPTFNVSAFERQLDHQSGEGEENVTHENTDVTMEQDLSAGSKSVLSLTLKTPFVNIQSERAGLRRKPVSRSQPSVDAFDEAVQKHLERQGNQEYTVIQDARTLEESNWQKFTLGLSNVTVPDITTDIVMSNTELYPQPAVSISELKEDHDGDPEMSGHESEKAYERDDEELADQEDENVVDDHQDEQSKISESESVLFQKTKTDSQLHAEEEMDIIPPSQDLSPDEIPFAPTQAMTEPVPQAQEEVEIGECRIEDFSKVEFPSQLPERITRRAYHSEGGAVMPGVTARGTKSLGGRLISTEEGEGQFDIPETELEEIEQRESRMEDLSNVEFPSQLPERITRRAHYSEGGAVMPGGTARARGTKSLGGKLVSTEEGEGQFDIPETELEEIEQRESRMEDLSNVEFPSQLPERITQRAYRSEGGRVISGVTARGTKSLGGILVSTEEGEGQSDILETEIVEMEQRESRIEDFSNVEFPSQLPERITQRAYHSEGGAVMPGGTATARGTKSLGAGLITTEEDEGQFDIPEAEMEEIEQRESRMEDLSNVEFPSQLPERITRRAHHSEGGAVMPGVTARARGTKSLGAGLNSTEREPQSFTNDSRPDELPNMEEEPHGSPVSTSISPTLKHTPSETHQASLAEADDDEGEGITRGDTIEDEDENVVTSTVHESPTPDTPAAEDEQEEEEENEEEEEEDGHSEELSMQTPAFIRQRKEVPTPSALQMPTALKVLNAGPEPKVVKPRAKQKKTTSDVLPKSYVMSVFKHFAKTKVATDVYPIISEILHKYFDRLADDLEAYSAHAKRKTIEVEDVELLMKRQGFVTDSTPVNVLIEKFLPLEYRKLLIPVATSGNKVIPNQRR